MSNILFFILIIINTMPSNIDLLINTFIFVNLNSLLNQMKYSYQPH